MDKGNICPVCENIFAINVYLTKCNHTFHYSCIKFILDKYKQCPICDENLTLLDIQKVDVLNTSSGIADEESMWEQSATQYINRKEEVRPISAKGSKLIVDNSERRVRNNESEQGASRLPNVNIYNHNGNVIVCDTYEPKTLNAFGFGGSSFSKALENESEKRGLMGRCLAYFYKSDDNQNHKQLENKKQDEEEYPEEYRPKKISNQTQDWGEKLISEHSNAPGATYE